MSKLEEILKNTVIDFDTYFHLLRHFHQLDEEFLLKFSNQTQYKEDDIRQQLEKSGSKFRYSFANNPEELINNLALEIDYKAFYISTNENKTEIAIEFDHEVYPKGIGFDGIAAIRNLNEQERESIVKTDRDDFMIKKLKTKKNKTWKLNLILFKKEDKYLIATFFPGIYAPPFPNKEIHSEKQMEEFSKFWNAHVLISS